jgi:hypothetical protein
MQRKCYKIIQVIKIIFNSSKANALFIFVLFPNLTNMSRGKCDPVKYTYIPNVSMGFMYFSSFDVNLLRIKNQFLIKC